MFSQGGLRRFSRGLEQHRLQPSVLAQPHIVEGTRRNQLIARWIRLLREDCRYALICRHAMARKLERGEGSSDGRSNASTERAIVRRDIR
jgi:hypothetical protein